MAGESAHFGLRDRPPTPAVRPFDLPPRMMSMLDRAKAGLAEPFRGIATNGGEIIPGLFAINKTGVSLAPLLEAARSFLSGLTAEQRKRATFEIGDEAWRKWSNIHPWLMRHGICLADFDGHQREAALALMRETMSAAWYQGHHAAHTGRACSAPPRQPSGPRTRPMPKSRTSMCGRRPGPKS